MELILQDENSIIGVVRNLHHPFSYARLLFKGFNRERDYLIKEIEAADKEGETTLRSYLASALEYVGAHSSVIYSPPRDNSAPILCDCIFDKVEVDSSHFEIEALSSTAFAVKDNIDLEIKSIKTYIKTYKAICEIKTKWLNELIDILGTQTLHPDEQCQRIMEKTKISRWGANYIINYLPIRRLLNFETTKELTALNILLEYMSFLKSIKTKKARTQFEPPCPVKVLYTDPKDSPIDELSPLQQYLLATIYDLKALPEYGHQKTFKVIMTAFEKLYFKYGHIQDYIFALSEMVHRPPYYADGHGNFGVMGVSIDGKTFFIEEAADIHYNEVRLSEAGVRYVLEHDLINRLHETLFHRP